MSACVTLQYAGSSANGGNALEFMLRAVEKGHLCFAWLEESFEVTEEDFNRVDESLRGQLPEGYYIQWLLTFNPYSASSWLKARFFDTPSENVLAMTTTYRCNEFLSADDRAIYEEVERTDPDRAKVICFGEWGIESGQYFSMWRESLHVVKPFEIPRDWLKFRAMDFGQARPYAVLWFAIDYDGNMFVYRELYGWGGKPNVGTGETAKQIGEKIVELESPEEALRYGVLDSACWSRNGVTDPTIEEELNRVLLSKGLIPFIPSSKGRLEGANAFKQRLIGNEMEDGNYKSATKFFSTCIHCLRTIPMIGHDKHKPELPDTNATSAVKVFRSAANSLSAQSFAKKLLRDFHSRKKAGEPIVHHKDNDLAKYERSRKSFCEIEQ